MWLASSPIIGQTLVIILFSLHILAMRLGRPDAMAHDKRIQHEVNKDMQYGTVKWFNDAKGFGFISPEDGTADVFVHFSAIAAKGFRSLQEGQRVSYQLTQGPKGAQASEVTPAA